MEFLVGQPKYLLFIFLLLLGLYAIAVKRNYVKKIIGMIIFQTAVIFFFISASAKDNAALPIIEHHHGSEIHEVNPDDYVNPLPHVLMLTAIVVGVATLGVALAISQGIYREFGTLEEHEVADSLLQSERRV